MHLTTGPPHLLLLTVISTTTLFVTCGALQHQHPDGSASCIPAERASLLSFKKGVTIDPTNRLASWHCRDCCRWRGVRCSNETTSWSFDFAMEKQTSMPLLHAMMTTLYMAR
ncbi:hypothetical protein C2845_PM03G18320 [Panicum miliaceum]|uniref:Leucine-rich repeat-containing N-terminal plant-type domain-containing protein n=1 Tax=Panicum miliaceum TaxID=4540 RepID=A0A3L6TE90_PANMI|nr:hypothetical protein C2845_PM03G18320 [Panicum miliaceum]